MITPLSVNLAALLCRFSTTWRNFVASVHTRPRSSAHLTINLFLFLEIAGNDLANCVREIKFFNSSDFSSMKFDSIFDK